jgi:hypothetical protein
LSTSVAGKVPLQVLDPLLRFRIGPVILVRPVAVPFRLPVLIMMHAAAQAP